jgi:hypothetical protein
LPVTISPGVNVGKWANRVSERVGCATVGIDSWYPTLRKKREGPRISYCAAPALAACAAFYKESRMKFVDPTKPYRKSGGMGHPGICALPDEDRKCPVSYPAGRQHRWTSSRPEPTRIFYNAAPTMTITSGHVMHDTMSHPLRHDERERHQRKHDLEGFGAFLFARCRSCAPLRGRPGAQAAYPPDHIQVDE